MNKFSMILSKRIISVRKVLLKDNVVVKTLDALFEKESWWINTSEDIEYNQYYYLINDNLTICDPLTQNFTNTVDSFFTTLSTYLNSSMLSEVKFLSSTICSKLDKDSKPIQRKNIYYKNIDPIAIINFSVFSENRITLVITIEWVCNGELIWLTSKPYMVIGNKRSYNGINIAKDIPCGNWECNLYLSNSLVASEKFNIVEVQNSGNVESIFINTIT